MSSVCDKGLRKNFTNYFEFVIKWGISVIVKCNNDQDKCFCFQVTRTMIRIRLTRSRGWVLNLWPKAALRSRNATLGTIEATAIRDDHTVCISFLDGGPTGVSSVTASSPKSSLNKTRNIIERKIRYDYLIARYT